MNTLYKSALILIIIGAINWGMVGIFDINLVELVFGADTILTNVIYALVGISGLLSMGLLVKRIDNDRIHDQFL